MTHCIHFGACGGCAVDHREAIDKRRMVIAALRLAGFVEPSVQNLFEIPLQTRRRADLAVRRHGAVIELGLHRAGAAEIIDMQECVLLRPEIVTLLPDLRVLLRSLEALRRLGSIVINWLDAGPDILLRMDAKFTGPDRTKIIAFANRFSVSRISAATGEEIAEPVVILTPPTIRFSAISVEVPPGAFLQASAQGEAAILEAVLAALPKLNAKSFIVELFAGVGTLSFALAERARVDAYEGDPAAVMALDQAIRMQNRAGRIQVTKRDLYRQPVQPVVLTKAAAVVLDPPYSGAGAQMKFIAASKVKRVVYVSCNPDALAHDAGQLKYAGYELMSATPIDQFPYSENVESVVVFSR